MKNLNMLYELEELNPHLFQTVNMKEATEVMNGVIRVECKAEETYHAVFIYIQPISENCFNVRATEEEIGEFQTWKLRECKREYIRGNQLDEAILITHAILLSKIRKRTPTLC